jgi:hypothetical protein
MKLKIHEKTLLAKVTLEIPSAYAMRNAAPDDDNINTATAESKMAQTAPFGVVFFSST